MSRVPFWLVVLFALILCVTGGLTLLHRTGLISPSNSVDAAENEALPPETGLVVTSVERRNPGVLIIEGRAQPQALITISHNDQQLIAETADNEGIFSLPFRLPELGKGWQLLQLQTGSRQPLPLLVGLGRKTDPTLLALLQTPAGHWQPLTPPNALTIATISEAANGDWQLSGQHPSGSTLLLHIYSDDRLIATQTTDALQFTITVPKAQRPQGNLRVDAYDATTLAPVVRLALKLPLDNLFERVAAVGSSPNQNLWVWRDAAAQQGDAAETLPGQIIPVAIPTPVKAN